MGKVVDKNISRKLTGGSIELNKNKRKKRKKDLEKIRSDALTAKYNLRKKIPSLKKPTTKLTKALNAFASRRDEVDQILHANNNDQAKPICDRLLPRPNFMTGFFQGAVKGKEYTREVVPEKEFKNAILRGDALALMQDTETLVPRKFEETVQKNQNLKYYNEENLENSEKNSQSPVLCNPNRCKGKKINDFGKEPKDLEENTKHSAFREEKCRRYLFNDPSANELVDIPKSDEENNENTKPYGSRDKRTPPKKNEISFVDPKEYESVRSQTSSSNETQPLAALDPTLLKFYDETCKTAMNENFGPIVSSLPQDPLNEIIERLKTTYTKAHKVYCQKNQQTSLSSNSETLFEPSSAIQRALKVNTSQLNTSDVDTISNVSVEIKAIENDVLQPMLQHNVHNEENDRKRKRAPSSQTSQISESELDPNQLNFINRFLKDIETQTNFQSSENVKKNSKHIPAILRKNVTKKQMLLFSSKKEYSSLDQTSNLKMAQNLPAIVNFNPNIQNKSQQNKPKFFPTPAFNFAAPVKIPVVKNREPTKTSSFDNHKNSFQRTVSFGEIQEKTNLLSIDSNSMDQLDFEKFHQCCSQEDHSLQYPEDQSSGYFSLNSQCGSSLNSCSQESNFEQRYQFHPDTSKCHKHPIKYAAISGNYIPQKKPIYLTNENNFCLHKEPKHITNFMLGHQRSQNLSQCYVKAYQNPLPVPPCSQIMPQSMNFSNAYYPDMRYVRVEEPCQSMIPIQHQQQQSNLMKVNFVPQQAGVQESCSCNYGIQRQHVSIPVVHQMSGRRQPFMYSNAEDPNFGSMCFNDENLRTFLR